MSKQAQLSAERQRLLAQRLKGAGKPGDDSRQIPKRSPGETAPLSIGQHQMWVIDQMAPGNPAYNIPVAYRIRGEIDVRALEKSFHKIIERHEAWRTTFREFEGDAVQEIHPECPIQIDVTDLVSWPAEERESQARALAAQEAVKPFDLLHLPLVRVTLYRLGSDDHILLVNVHHIVGDGLSLNLMFDELDAFYRSATAGAPVSLPELPVQYAEFAAWQRDELSKVQYATQLEYWQRQLSGNLPVLEVPADKTRPVRQSFRGSNVDFSVPGPLAQALNRIGTQAKSTFFATALAAFQILLMRYSRAEDLVIGMPIANRPLPETDPLIGNFINVVALRCDLSGNPTFVEVLRRSRETTLNALSNKDIPFDLVVKNLHSPRDPSRNPVFQALLQVLPAVRVRLGELSLTRFDFELRFAQVDLTLHLYEEADGGYHGQIQYCADLFAGGTIERLSRNFVQLLHEIVRDPQQKVREIPILAEGERQQLLVEWNRTEADYPAGATLQALFARQAASTPDSTAVEFDGEPLTYRELDQRTNRLARHLRGLGLARGACVGVCMERSPELILCILAVVKAGGAYVPLDTASPPDRLALMLAESASALVLTRSTGLPSFTKASTRVVDFDAVDLSSYDATSLAEEGEGGDPAYVIFTSGSTGKPKGVAVPHRAIARLVINSDYVRFGPDDVVAHASNVAFDAATFEIWGALLNGGTLAVVPREVLLSHGDFASFLTSRKITTLFLTTSLFNEIAMENPAAFRPLKNLVFGGEAGSPDCVRHVLEHGAPQRLVNGYGPTETTTFAICHVFREVPEDAVTVPIGRPIANTTAYLLDSRLQPVPCGALGELFIGGPGVAIGYVNDSALTAERFLGTPFGRLYRTGDLARYRADGVIEFCGRMDSQLKLRGFRIEPGEIETALQHHSAVRQAAVIARTEGGAVHSLIAYLVPHAGAPPATDLREFLSPRLPAYMIPSAFVWMETLPLTDNGKLDVRAFPELPLESKPAREYAPPQNSIQLQLVEIWEEALNRKPIGIRDDFFELGGHSLLAARVITQIASRLGSQLNFGTFFNQPTIEEHARVLMTAKAPLPPPPCTVLHPDGQRTPVFFFHGDLLGGGIFCKTLASSIGADRPFYVLNPHGLEGDEIPTTIEAMAADRLKWIRQIRPHGPYIIGGYCNGALVAYHAARLLRDAGEQVAAVLMLGTDGSNVRFRFLRRIIAASGALLGEDDAAQRRRFLRIRNRFCDYESIVSYYISAAADLRKQPFRVQLTRIWRKTRRILRRLTPNAPTDPDSGARRRRPGDPPAQRHKEAIVNVYDDITRAHIPVAYESPVFLFWPKSEPPTTSRGPAEGWKDICTQFHLIDVPGDHTTCVAQSANVAVVGEAMRNSIAQAESLLSQSSL